MVMLSAGTGSRNVGLPEYADKGKQPGINGVSFLRQVFKQTYQYYRPDLKGMVITSNDGIKAIAQDDSNIQGLHEADKAVVQALGDVALLVPCILCKFLHPIVLIIFPYLEDGKANGRYSESHYAYCQRQEGQ